MLWHATGWLSSPVLAMHTVDTCVPTTAWQSSHCRPSKWSSIHDWPWTDVGAQNSFGCMQLCSIGATAGIHWMQSQGRASMNLGHRTGRIDPHVKGLASDVADPRWRNYMLWFLIIIYHVLIPQKIKKIYIRVLYSIIFIIFWGAFKQMVVINTKSEKTDHDEWKKTWAHCSSTRCVYQSQVTDMHGAEFHHGYIESLEKQQRAFAKMGRSTGFGFAFVQSIIKN